MKIKPDGKGGWSLVGAPKGTTLLRVTISYPETKSQAGGKTTYHIAGPPNVTIRVRHPDGSAESITGVSIKW